jgi:hypothetical protein
VRKDPDVLAFDAQLGWLYVAGESGEISLFTVQEQAVSKLYAASQGSNAHLVASATASHRACLPLKALAGKPMMRITQTKP